MTVPPTCSKCKMQLFCHKQNTQYLHLLWDECVPVDDYQLIRMTGSKVQGFRVTGSQRYVCTMEPWSTCKDPGAEVSHLVSIKLEQTVPLTLL